MLDCVRRGCPTDGNISTLQQRVIDGSVTGKFNELSQSSETPVCLFPTRKAYQKFNNEMLLMLASNIYELVCTDQTWTKKLEDQLNSDCNMTAGLEAKLLLVNSARVMLRRNIDTKRGLVNGAIGTEVHILTHFNCKSVFALRIWELMICVVCVRPQNFVRNTKGYNSRKTRAISSGS